MNAQHEIYLKSPAIIQQMFIDNSHAVVKKMESMRSVWAEKFLFAYTTEECEFAQGEYNRLSSVIEQMTGTPQCFIESSTRTSTK